jgi:ADP-glucose pyrophosphorylase
LGKWLYLAVRQTVRHFVRYDADYYLILAGDQLYRTDYGG